MGQQGRDAEPDQPLIDPRVASALAVPTRARLLTVLRAVDLPRGVVELAETVGLHPNTTRAHLEVLVEAGLVERAAQTPHGPGRPQVMYQAVAGTGAGVMGAAGAIDANGPATNRTATNGPGANEHCMHLAAALVDEVAASAEASRIAVDAGRRWAEVIDRLDWPDREHRPEEAVTRLVDLLGRLGFEPSTEPLGDRIYLHACPFARLARRSTTVVCGAHLGLLRAGLERLRTSVRVAAVDPFVREDLCVVRLAESG